MPEWVWVLAGGKLLIYLIMGLPPAHNLKNLQDRGGWIGYFGKLFSCDLCLGTWVYFALCCFHHVSLSPVYVPLVSESITAAIFAWTIHVFFLGLKLKYGSFEVE